MHRSRVFQRIKSTISDGLCESALIMFRNNHNKMTYEECVLIWFLLTAKVIHMQGYDGLPFSDSFYNEFTMTLPHARNIFIFKTVDYEKSI